MNVKNIQERLIAKKNGFAALFLILLSIFAEIGLLILGIVLITTMQPVLGGILIAVFFIGLIISFVFCAGLHIVNPNEAMILTLFGNYYGTIRESGYYYTNPFCTRMVPKTKPDGSVSIGSAGTQATVEIGGRKTISTKTLTLSNEKQKVNDVLGNPIIIGAVVIWRVVEPTKAVFQVDDYTKFLSIQCDSTIRNIARMYPYDVMDEEEMDEVREMTLRGSSQSIAESMREELQQRVNEAGLEVIEVRITHLSYSEEIAAAMLQRQQAFAIIAARKKIVEGAVSMVKMAIDQLSEQEIVALDDERKAAMVSNLLVVLCGNKDAQPIVNSGSIY
ncbi:MAG: SPFH domain-containing protein [Clostridium sp.]|nr:SPFH domain-containing protein [Clostridium sp.]